MKIPLGGEEEQIPRLYRQPQVGQPPLPSGDIKQHSRIRFVRMMMNGIAFVSFHIIDGF